MTIYIYSRETDALVGQFRAETNKQCEDWAEAMFGSNDYSWTYTRSPA